MNAGRKSELLSKVKAMVKGKRAEVPATVTGRKLREELQVPQDRMMIVRPASGGIARGISDADVLQVGEGDEFDDVPVGHWG